MRIVAFSMLALGFCLAAAQLTACSNSADDCSATLSCGNAGPTAGNAGKPGSGGGGTDGGGGNGNGGTPSTGGVQNISGTDGSGGAGGSAGSECNGDVASDPVCWTTNALGVFVSSESGDDAAGDGTKEAPYATIMKGVAAAAGKNVYVCRGTAESYDEQIILDASADGTKLYGGFDCADWNHSTTRNVAVHSPLPIALRIKDIAQGVTIENISFVAADGNATDLSSYGAFVSDSEGVVLRRVELTAGNGMKGKDGEPGIKGENGSVAGTAPVGSDACEPDPLNVAGGKWLIESSCGSQGGPGATGAKNTSNGNSGSAGSPTENVDPVPDINNGGPGETTGVTDFQGKSGAAGNPGGLGAGALALGSFSASGYSVASGKDGMPGFPGQGGGGGGAAKGSAICFGASGGAGGMGGCGGTAGKAGQGGGASVALFSWKSEVALEASTLAAGAGGGGGKGGDGGGGGAGADGGVGGAEDGVGLKRGGRGGIGGTGGPGGSGSGGSGGPSYGVSYSGSGPALSSDTTVTFATGGAKGMGGTLGGAKAPDGFDGAAAAQFQIL